MLIAGAALWALEFKLAAMLRKTTPVLTLSCVPKCKDNFKVLFFLSFFLSNVEAGQRLSCETRSGIKVLAESHSLALVMSHRALALLSTSFPLPLGQHLHPLKLLQTRLSGWALPVPNPQNDNSIATLDHGTRKH